MTERAIPAAVQANLEDPASTTALLAFVLIEHPNLAKPIRVVTDAMDYLRDGHLWMGVLFGFRPPTDNEEAPSAVLTLPDTDSRLSEALRTLTDRALVTTEVCSSSDFDLSLDPREPKGPVTPIYPTARHELVDIELADGELSGRLMLRDFSQEPWPMIFATQSRLPGLYR